MSDMTIEQFCDKSKACKAGRTWALKNCTSMQEVWNIIKPDWLIWIATREGVLTDKELRLFAVWSARKVQHLMTDSRSINALDVAERYAHGHATKEELSAARSAASDVAWTTASDAAWAAASDSARAVTRAAAKSVAWDAARDAAMASARKSASDAARAAVSDGAWSSAWSADWFAVWNAAWNAASDSAMDAARAAQADWLRKNTQPNFKETKP